MRTSKPIGIVTPAYPPASGNMAHYVSQMAQEMTSRGIVVRVITTDPTGKLPPFEKQGLISISRFPTYRNDDVYFFSPSLWRWLSSNGDRFALLHAHAYHTPISAMAAQVCQKNKIPFLLTPHYQEINPTGLQRLMDIPYGFFSKWMVHRAGRILCASEMERRLMHQKFGGDLPTLVVPSGVNLKAISSAAPFPDKNDRKYILFIGQLERYKLMEQLVDTLPLLPEEYELVVVGLGPQRKALEQKARKLNVTPRLHMMRQVSQENLYMWYKTADVFVTFAQKEAFGTVALEALAAGLPAVANDIPAHMDLAHYVPPGRLSFVGAESTPTELAAAFQEAVNRGILAKIPADTFPTWEKSVDTTLAQYFSLLGGA